MKYPAGGNLKQEWTSLTSRLSKVYILKSWSRGGRWPPFSCWEGLGTKWFYLFGVIDFLYPIVLIQVVPIHSLVMPKELNSDPFIMKLTAGLNLCDRALYYDPHPWRTRKLYNVNWFGLFINIPFPWSVHLFAYLNIDSIDIFNFSQNGILSK